MLKPQTEKQRAHMYFKQHKAGMKVPDDARRLIKKYYPFMRAV